MAAVEGDAMHLVDTREGSVFAEDFGGRSFHAAILAAWQRSGE
jgi:hypothetical protein